MESFLRNVSKDLLNRFGDNLSEVTVVFPSRRASLFFSKYLSEQIDKPIWSPKITTLNELIHQLVGLKIEDRIHLVARLYRIFNQISGKEETFDAFYYWGEVMLNDFDQIDKYLVDARQLFGNIQDLKEIDIRFGGFTEEQMDAINSYIGIMESTETSEVRQNYLNIWTKLFEIYTQFKEELNKDGLAYEGMVYRECAEQLSEIDFLNKLPQPIVFIGFNALNESEKKFFNVYQKSGQGLFYWDYDPEFIANEHHEAGFFIREHLKTFPNALNIDSTEKTPKVQIISAPTTVGQTKLLPKIFSTITDNNGKLDESTAVIFPQENILLPALQAIPTSVEQMNITMGYPLKETPAYSLMEALIRLQINVRTSGSTSFYFKDVVDILSHPYVRASQPTETDEILRLVKTKNRIYPTIEELATTPLLSNIFKTTNNSKELTDYMLVICSELTVILAQEQADNEEGNKNFDIEFLYTLHKSLTRLGETLTKLQVEISPKLYIQLLRRTFNQERVSFTGEPLHGLQIMGFLETRALDFENIVILSFNDDIIPSKGASVSFITPSLRKAFNLPTQKQHDSIYAYYFHRLIHRAKNVFLVYTNRTEGMTSGEKSRYALQLEMSSDNSSIENIDVTYDIEFSHGDSITIPKTEELIETLLNNLKRKGEVPTISPSGLTTYLMCPLSFYFRYVIGLYDEDEVTEEVGAVEFGLILHNTMESLYGEFTGKTMDKAVLEKLINNRSHIEETLNQVFIEIFEKKSAGTTSELSGRNLLAYKAILHIIERILLLDKNRAPFKIISQEETLSVSIPVTKSSKIDSMQLGGMADRVENNGEEIWLIDYKTGSSQGKGEFEHVGDLFDATKVKRVREVFQTFCYSLALMEKYPNHRIKPLLWFVRAAKTVEDLFVYQKQKEKEPVNDFVPYADDFKTNLSALLDEILDESVAFTQTSDTDICRFCPYARICGRD